ncbi:MAG: Dabb family protein [Lentisphaeria bacterium]|nr:Dabb family protein [Lentisphaeria bacterium]
MVVHTVFFWTRDMTAEDAARFEAGLAGLLRIPVVAGGWYGPPAGTPDRDVVDASYQYGLTVLFDDVAAHDLYQDCAEHQAFIADFARFWERVRVYDYQAAPG